MGRVFAATDEVTGRAAAIKILLEEEAGDRQLEARFLQEGRALAALRHPGIVEVLTCEESEEGTLYLAMERLQGSSLREWLRKQPKGRATTELACSIGLQIADAMAAVHRAGIVHRDLKPENIMISSPEEGQGGALQTKIVDFGIAKVQSGPTEGASTQVWTEEHKVLGTHQYMAPEQWKGASMVTAKIDVYALGVLLFEMLAGELPFNGEEPIEYTHKHTHETPPALKAKAPTAPAALGVLLSAMLAKNPDERPSMRRCRAVLEALSRNMRDECPLPGLHPFTEAQAELFFGRRTDLDQVAHRLDLARIDQARWVQIEGPSGAGKSSLVQAGILRALKDERGPEGPLWLIACLRPSQTPLRALAQALLDALSTHGLKDSLEQVIDVLHTEENALRNLTSHLPPGPTLLLVVEQMEELFTLGSKQRDRFDALLTEELTRPESRVRLLTTLRSDFLHCLDLMPELSRLLNKASRYYLGAMNDKSLEEVVLGMASRAGMSLSDDLARRIVVDTASTDCRLPLLGHTLRALWSHRDNSSNSIEKRYEEMGGVGGSLVGHAKRLLESLSKGESERAKWIILALVQVGRDIPDTRRSRTRFDVLEAAGGDTMANSVLNRLTGATGGSSTKDTGNLSLLVVSDEQGKSPEQQHVDLIHEALLQQVPIIAQWIREERSRLACYDELEKTATAWEREGYRSDMLASPKQLHHFQEYTEDDCSERFSRMTSPNARRYLKESKKHLRRNRRISQAVVIVIIIAVAAAIGLAIYASQEKSLADANRRSLLAGKDEIVSHLDWDFSLIPGTHDVRYKMLDGVYQSFHQLSESDHASPEVKLIAIKADHRLGDFELYDGTLARAEKIYNEALTEIESSPNQLGSSSQWQAQAALNHSKLGKIALARKNLSLAHEHFDDAVASLKTLYKDNDDSNRTLATSYEELAELDLAQNRPKEAFSHYIEAIKLFDKLSKDNEYDQSLLAEALCGSASAARRLGDLITAEYQLSKAQGVISGSAASTYSILALARTSSELGAVYEVQKSPKAIERFRQSYQLTQKLHRGDPTRKAFTLAYADSLRWIIRTSQASQEQRDAKQAYEEVAAKFSSDDREDTRFPSLDAP